MGKDVKRIPFPKVEHDKIETGQGINVSLVGDDPDNVLNFLARGFKLAHGKDRDTGVKLIMVDLDLTSLRGEHNGEDAKLQVYGAQKDLVALFDNLLNSIKNPRAGEEEPNGKNEENEEPADGNATESPQGEITGP